MADLAVAIALLQVRCTNAEFMDIATASMPGGQLDALSQVEGCIL